MFNSTPLWDSGRPVWSRLANAFGCPDAGIGPRQLVWHFVDPEAQFLGLAAFSTPLADALAKAKTVGHVKRTPEADRLWESVYPALTEARAGAFGKATERPRPQVMRLALIYAPLDGSESIGVEHLRAALAVWDYCEASAAMLFGQSPSPDPKRGQNQEAFTPLKVLEVIAESPGVSRSELLRAFRSASAVALGEALAWLEANGLAYRQHSDGKGRPAECWFPTSGKEGSNADASPSPVNSFLPSAEAEANADDQSGETMDCPTQSDGVCPPDAEAQQFSRNLPRANRKPHAIAC